jgi:hypothetical protein
MKITALKSLKTSAATWATAECNISEDCSNYVSHFISVVAIPTCTISATHQQLQVFEISESVLDDLCYLLLLYLLAGFGGET